MTSLPNASSPLTRTSAPLRTQVTDLLKELIADGTFPPGGRLVERALCERFGASRSTLREAFRELEAEGLVTVVPGRGPIVTIVGEEDIRNLYQVREVIEMLAIELFVDSATDEALAQLETDFADLRAAHLDHDSAQINEGKKTFYRTLFRAAGNPVILEVVERLQSRITSVRLLSYSRPERVAEGLRELDVVMEAIRAGDRAAARAAYSYHMSQALEACLVALRLRDVRPDHEEVGS